MNKLQLPQAKLLYAIGQSYRLRKIDQTQKRILKEKMITDNVQIFQLLEQTDQENVLIQKLVTLVKSSDQDDNVVPVRGQVPIPTEQEQTSSPWGQFLRKRKIEVQHEHKNQVKGLKNIIHPQKAQ